MKFEEALAAMREGKTARYPKYDYDDTDGYWIAGYIGIINDSEKILTIHRVNKEGCALSGKSDWGIKCWALMSDKWEIAKETT